MAEKVFGTGAAAFTTLSRGLEWEPASDTLLGAGASPKDFTLEFWLYPIRLSEGEEVFSWIGMQTLGEKQRPQGVYGRITNRKLGWEFFNFFQTSGDETTLFTLMGLTPLLPRRWNHHLVRYDSRIGLLEYLVNGEIEAIIHTTPSQKESSEIYAPLCGDAQPPKITLGGSYLGLIEEFRLSRRFITEPQLTQFTLEAGTAQTEVLDLGQPGARFSGIATRENLRGSSIVTYAYRQSETLFRAEDLEPAWRLLSPGGSLPGDNRGRYLQLKMDFLADGSGHWAPRLSSLMIKYKKDILPLAPMNFRVEPGDQRVDLRWNRLGNAAAEGYRLYFGTSPGIYFGDTQGGQKSPIDVGNVDHYTLEGLTNGTLYYFALVAYGGYRGKLTSEYSVERSARPSGYRSDPP